ncbi:MAG: cell division protein FtsL [Desulfobacterales bacterium]|jgi:cell division protein FtsL|nr:cell division protein FtsL [Desulfobacterales bacterium]
MSTPPANIRRRSPRRIALWLSILLVFIAELLVTTWVRVQCNNLGYEIAALNGETQRLVELQDNLRVELARLKSPQRITRIAREMGLTMPAPAQVMVLPGAP